MKCDRCQEREATVMLTKIINGEKTEMHLCEKCANETEGLYFNSELSFQNLLSSLLDMTIKKPEQEKANTTLKCPSCNMSYHQFRKTGKFGCLQCYETFGLFLPQILKRIHGNNKHIGKIPKKTASDLIIKRKIRNLKDQLKEAIEKEAFENAAKLRDEIRALEKGDATSC